MGAVILYLLCAAVLMVAGITNLNLGSGVPAGMFFLAAGLQLVLAVRAWISLRKEKR